MGSPEPEADRGVYGISVAAELVGTGVQNLRLYEARGLLEPERTEGGTRRYSAEILLGPGDRIILDDDSVVTLEARAMCLVPATLYSRMLARATAA